MSDTRDPPSNVTPIAAAFERAQKQPAKKKRTSSPAPVPMDGGGGRGEIVEPPRRLPPNAPVTALGRWGLTYYFLDSGGQFIPLQAKEIGRLVILALFGGKEYLVANWRAYSAKGPKDDFDHGMLAPVLIASCAEKELFNPMERVRGPGAWREDDGGLILHCGDQLYTASGAIGTGLRRGYLYPASDALPEPDLRARGGIEGPAAKVLDQLDTWNWSRGPIDAKLALGWMGAAMLGAAADWRPMIWITGGRGSGKSTLQKLIRWIFGQHALIHSEDASRAGIFQRVKHASLPVSLDEIEAKGNNQRAQDIIELARIASSGGLVLRGGADGQPTEFTARNCFAFSSINIPPLDQADRSRMAILDLGKLTSGAGAMGAYDDDNEDDPILGSRLAWEFCGRQLRGRLLTQWQRYAMTLRGYRRELLAAGHDARAADQFGSLGAAYDLLMCDAFDPAAAKAWAAMLPAASLAETTGFDSDEQSCLNRLLSAMPAVFRDGAKETIAHWLKVAKREREQGGKGAENTDANRVLAKMGLKLYRDARDRDGLLWWVAVSKHAEELEKVFFGTKWGGRAGAQGVWGQAMMRIKDAHPVRLRIDGTRHWCVALPWEAIIPPTDQKLDADDLNYVDEKDRE